MAEEVKPTPVEVISPVPIPVVIAGPVPHIENRLPSTTTPEQDRTTLGQRRVNLIWETTQATIAVLVVGANVIVGSWQGMNSTAGHQEYPIILSSSLFLVVGFYFSRTNHTKVGGVGDTIGKER